MQNAFNNFRRIVEDNRTSMIIYDHLDSNIRPPFDYSDLLRWQWAQSVSALDKLIHDLIRRALIDVINGRRVGTAKFDSFPFSWKDIKDIKQNPSSESQILDRIIVASLGYKSFQEPEKIKDGLSLIWAEEHKWEVLANDLSLSPKDLTSTLKGTSKNRVKYSS